MQIWWKKKRENKKSLSEASIYQRKNKMTVYSFDL